MTTKITTKIVMVITKANWGGAQKYVFDIAESLKQINYSSTNTTDYDITVVHGEPSGELSTRLDSINIKTIYIRNLERDINIIKELNVFIRLTQIFKNIRPDIVHLNSSKIGILGSLAGRLAGTKKVIFTAHGWAFNEPKSTLYAYIIKIISWLTITLSHKIIVSSEYERKQVIDWVFIPKNKVVTINNGIKEIDFLDKQSARNSLIDLYKDTHVNLQKEYSLFQEGYIIVGTIAELHTNKGLNIALQSMVGIKRIQYVIIGSGDELIYLQKLIKLHNLSSTVYLLGKISEASRYLKAFDIFLLPSLKEGFPFAILEAGLSKIPVISTRVGGIPEIITSMLSGILTEPGNIEELNNALQYCIQHEGNCRLFASRLHRYISHNLTIQVMLKRTLDVYHKP